jgi:hypothetical protein
MCRFPGCCRGFSPQPRRLVWCHHLEEALSRPGELTTMHEWPEVERDLFPPGDEAEGHHRVQFGPSGAARQSRCLPSAVTVRPSSSRRGRPAAVQSRWMSSSRSHNRAGPPRLPDKRGGDGQPRLRWSAGRSPPRTQACKLQFRSLLLYYFADVSSSRRASVIAPATGSSVRIRNSSSG